MAVIDTESAVSPWVADVISGYTNTVTPTLKTGDAPTGGGSNCLSVAVTSGLTDKMCLVPLTGTYLSGNAYQLTFWMKRVSGGGVRLRAFFGSKGTADRAQVDDTSTTGGGWIQTSMNWTPSGNRTDAVFAIAGVGSVTTTVYVDLVSAGPQTVTATGIASAEAFGTTIASPGLMGVGLASAQSFGAARLWRSGEHPLTAVYIDWDGDGEFGQVGDDVTSLVKSVTWSRGRSADFSSEAQGAATIVLRNDDERFTLSRASTVGRAVRIVAAYGGHDYPQFFGYVQRLSLSPGLNERTATITCYDPLKVLSEIDTSVSGNGWLQRSARDFRREVLEDAGRGRRNLLANGHFETDTAHWDKYGGVTHTRITTDHCPATTGTTCLQATTPGEGGLAMGYADLAPMTVQGRTYRGTVWVKCVSGPLAVRVGLGADPNDSPCSEVFANLTPDTWQRVTVTHTATKSVSWGQAYGAGTRFALTVYAVGAGTYLIDGASMTGGAEDVEYADLGTGRWPNWCGNGSFDGWWIGWRGGLTNLCSNPGFETNTTGWSHLADSFHTQAGSTVQRGGGKLGSYGGWVTIDTNGQGLHYAHTGTFYANQTYSVHLWIQGSGTGPQMEFGIGSNGTPADCVRSGNISSNLYTLFELSWTPAADRSDVHVWVKSVSGFYTGYSIYVDECWITEGVDADETWGIGYHSYTPCPSAPRGSTADSSAAVVHDGSMSMEVTTIPVVGSGRLFDFCKYSGTMLGGPPFVAGVAYTASLWLRAPDAMPYSVSFGGSHDFGATWTDKTTVTGTLTPDTWRQVTVTWIPTANANNMTARCTYLAIGQTDATARTFYVDQVRVTPGSSADDWNDPSWDLATEDAKFGTNASLAGTALAGLTRLNALTLSRHWVRPLLTAPFYAYKTEDPATVAAKAVSETWTEGTIRSIDGYELDRDSIVNLIPVTANTGGTRYVGDAASIREFGARPGQEINGGDFLLGLETVQPIADSLLARYSQPKARPSIVRVNQFPSQLERELNDLVLVTTSREGWASSSLLIASLSTTVTADGHWNTTYTLEEFTP